VRNTHDHRAPPQCAAARRIAGTEFTAADVQMSFPQAAASPAGLDASRPRLIVFLRRIQARAAYRRASERGGAYSF
jgi:glutathione S-transferase